MKASAYGEMTQLANEIAAACSQPPACTWNGAPAEPLAPTLARHVEADVHLREAAQDLRLWAGQNLPPRGLNNEDDVDLIKPQDVPSDIVATLLYPVTDRSYRELYELARSWGATRRKEVIDVALRSRTRRDELLREFRSEPYVYDLVIDIGAYRDLHRHRRCQQFRQELSVDHSYAVPPPLVEAGLECEFRSVMDDTVDRIMRLPPPASHYLLPFAAKSRFLFKMDFAQAEYICRLRSGVKGHFSYRDVAWRMKEKLAALEPELRHIATATPPWVEDPLKR
jgi:hypothetical protein